jgi:hypothetical protein
MAAVRNSNVTCIQGIMDLIAQLYDSSCGSQAVGCGRNTQVTAIVHCVDTMNSICHTYADIFKLLLLLFFFCSCGE